MYLLHHKCTLNFRHLWTYITRCAFSTAQHVYMHVIHILVFVIVHLSQTGLYMALGTVVGCVLYVCQEGKCRLKSQHSAASSCIEQMWCMQQLSSRTPHRSSPLPRDLANVASVRISPKRPASGAGYFLSKRRRVGNQHRHKVGGAAMISRQ